MATHAPPHLMRAQRARGLHGVYVIVNESPNAIVIARAAVDAGVRVLQYRAKNAVNLERVRALRELARKSGALLVLNDDWRLALASGCDGVHLGPDDDGFDDPASVRRSAPELLIGLSCGTAREITAASAADVDYFGVGSVFATASKPDAGSPIGLDGLRRLAGATTLPVAAIGGVTARTLPSIRRCGVAMAAVIGAVANAGDPQRAAGNLVAAWNGAAA